MPREAWLRQGSSFQKQKADHSTAHSFKSSNQLVKVMTNMANMCPSEPFQRALDEAVLCHTQPQDTMVSFWGRGFTQFGHLPIQRDPLSLDQSTRVRLLTLSGSFSAWGNPMAQAKPVQFRPAASASWFVHVAVLLAAGITKTLCQQMGAACVDGSACHDDLHRIDFDLEPRPSFAKGRTQLGKMADLRNPTCQTTIRDCNCLAAKLTCQHLTSSRQLVSPNAKRCDKMCSSTSWQKSLTTSGILPGEWLMLWFHTRIPFLMHTSEHLSLSFQPNSPTRCSSCKPASNDKLTRGELQSHGMN